MTPWSSSLLVTTAVALRPKRRVSSSALSIESNARKNEVLPKRRFPEDFKFGATTSSYQIEGGWDADGKGMSIWDHVMRTEPYYAIDNTTGDIAADSYHLYKRDLEMLKEMGATIYRFSISWPRILPTGLPDFVNPHGVAYYNALINELLANGIQPFPTIYHWELPQNISANGGWLNEKTANLFGDYARVVFKYFGDRVKLWNTINEPYIHCYQGYTIGDQAPRIKSPGVGFYECGRNLLLGHAKAYHIYDEEFRKIQGGEVGIPFSIQWPLPSSNSTEDAEAVQDYITFNGAQYVDPVYSETGNYPQRLIDRVAEASARQGLPRSRLRPFTQKQVDYIRGTSDFFAVNHYTTDIVYRNSSIDGMYVVPSYQDDAHFGTYQDSSWLKGNDIWMSGYPQGFYELLMYIKKTYRNPRIYVTESGFSTRTGLNDNGRVTYIKTYLNALLQAIEDGANVKAYCVWTLVDTFEWKAGYTTRFGLYELNITDPKRKRTARKSALVYKEIIRSKVIDFDYDPDPYAPDASFSIRASLFLTILSVILVSI